MQNSVYSVQREVGQEYCALFIAVHHDSALYSGGEEEDAIQSKI